MRHIRLWKGYYCRWNPAMRSQDPIYQRTRELLSLREQLKRQIDELKECKNDQNNRSVNPLSRLASPMH
jgi:myotubularin-related protein 1/2